MSFAHQAPPMETINPMEYYAFSLSPSITELYINEEEYISKIQNWYKKILQQLYDEIRFMNFSLLNMELSSSGRPHIHGRCTFEDVLGAYSRDLAFLRGIGTYCIKPIEDPLKWSDYVSKQYSLFRPILGSDYPRDINSHGHRKELKRMMEEAQKPKKEKIDILKLMSMRAPKADS